MNDQPILFAAKQAGEDYSQIYRIDPDGAGRRQVTHFKANEYNPRWAPDGKHILYDRQITKRTRLPMVTVADGKSPARIARGAQVLPTPLNTTEEIRLPEGREILARKDSTGAIVDLVVTFASGKRRSVPVRGAGFQGIAALPGRKDAVLAWKRVGTAESGWRVAATIDLNTGKARPWGEIGSDGAVFSPDGRLFLTCFNRKHPKTGKEEHRLCIGKTASPGALKTIATSEDPITADWRGGLRTQ